MCIDPERLEGDNPASTTACASSNLKRQELAGTLPRQPPVTAPRPPPATVARYGRPLTKASVELDPRVAPQHVVRPPEPEGPAHLLVRAAVAAGAGGGGGGGGSSLRPNLSALLQTGVRSGNGAVLVTY
jgi:hypothetical protein